MLVIVSLLMTVLTQALWLGLDALRRSRVDLSAQAVETMRLAWYREATAGLQPEYLDGPHPFRGESRRFSGLSTGAPVAHLGATQAVDVELGYDAAADRTSLTLRTATAGSPTTLLSWPGRDGEFQYVDDDGRSYERWPPPMANVPQLPRVIVLLARPARSGPLAVYTAIAGDRRTPLTIEDVMRGVGGATRP